MSTKKIVATEFKGATLKMYNLLKSGKGLTHNAVMAFKKSEGLASAYQILFRLRRIGLKTKQFTITATGDTKPERVYKLVKGVAKGTSAHWPKALPIRTKKSKSAKKTTAKKQVAKKVVAKKSSTKKTVAKKTGKKIVKAAPKPKQVEVTVGADDDNAIDE